MSAMLATRDAWQRTLRTLPGCGGDGAAAAPAEASV
jgi:hypothetical protein